MPKMASDASDSHIIIRKDHVLCTVCMAIEPIHPGDGTPMPAFLAALVGVARRHPRRKHRNPLA